MLLSQEGNPAPGSVPRSTRSFLDATWLQMLVLMVAVVLIDGQWTDVRSPVRAVAAFLFLLFAPGVSLVPLLGIDARWIQAVLVIPTSLAVSTAVTEIQIYAHLWSPRASILSLTMICIAGMIATHRRYRSDDR